MKRMFTASTLSLLLLLAACGTDSGAAPQEDGSAPTTPASPLSEFLYSGTAEDQQQVWQEQEKKVQELTASCMKAEGFEYTPVDQTQMWPEDPNAEAWKLWGTKEFAEKYGYGIHLNSMTAQPAQEFTDPNAEYVEAMSPSEREAYEIALYGSSVSGDMGGLAATSAVAVAEPEETVEESADTTDTETTDTGSADTGTVDASSVDAGTTATDEVEAAGSSAAEGPIDMSAMGCNGKAYEEIHGDQQAIYEDPEVNAMWEEQSRRYEELQKDPEIVEAKKSWSSCMADNNYPGLDDPDLVTNDLYEEWSELHGMSTSFSEDGATEIQGAEEPVTPDAAAVEAFKQKEIAMAIVDFDCKGNLTELQQAKNFEMETAFVEEYREVLTRLRDAQNGAG